VIVGILSALILDVRLFSPLYISFLILLPLALIFLQGPLGKIAAGRKDWLPSKKGEYLVENLFELFEILLSFLANSISFVRIGAFALNHIGMMLVVFALADSVGKTGSVFVFVIGNLFVICLEGLIVGIQVLRLEFYELFGRFYTGAGRDYSPFVIDYGNKKS
jgi:V/A-type H+-transporting ATPase subunit I